MPGTGRNSQWMRHSRAIMLTAVPPEIVPMLSVVPGGSNAPSDPARDSSSDSRSRKRTISDGEGDRVDPGARPARMSVLAGDGRGQHVDALMRADRAHAGRLADDHHARLGQARRQLGDQPAHPDATDLLVIGEGEVDRHGEPRRLERRRERQRAGDEALHVGGAAAVEAAVAFGQGERIARPALAHDRDHVGVARQRDAALAIGADGGEQIRLAARVVVDQPHRDAQRVETIGDEFDELEVGLRRDGVEADEPGEQLARARCRGPDPRSGCR